MNGWKYSPKGLLKAIFLSPKNDKKADRLCMKFFQPPIQCGEVPIPSISKSMPLFSAVPLFWKLSQPSGHRVATSVENMEGALQNLIRGLESLHGESMGMLKMTFLKSW